MAGILHLSNIDFAQDPELQQLIIVNEDEVDYGIHLWNFIIFLVTCNRPLTL